ncbi:hypothetical protein EMPS_06622 [Entomortierella parvispora]|uniref:Uncharacterized protein n=1 Tax=Entomortierella parvispora TaxID=205924 RepID=A0A9P3HCP9_9FUNG|nr:hypothetical protein EMPS_06622 [Entomortierella parvispora]
MSHIAIAVNPLDLPEIRLALADNLSLHTLSICVRVNKDWYWSFISPLWREITLSVNPENKWPFSTGNTTLDLAVKHKEFIQCLNVEDLNKWKNEESEEFWSAISGFSTLRSLELGQVYGAQAIVKHESIQRLGPQYSNLNDLDFDPNINLASESYEEILSSCPQLQTLRGGNVKAVVLTEGRSWVCTKLRLWSLGLDFGPADDYRGKITKLTESPDSTPSRSTKEEVGQWVEQMRNQVCLQLFGRMSLLVNLQTADFRVKNLRGCPWPLLLLDHQDSGLERLLQCPRLKEVMFDWDESELETYDWIKTHWKNININSPPDSADDYDDDEDYGFFDNGGYGDYSDYYTSDEDYY